MSRRVAVTGYGVFSAFGYGADALMDNVFTGRDGFAEVDRFDTRSFRVHRAAQAPGAPPLREVLAACGRAALDMAGRTATRDAPVLLGTQGDWRSLRGYFAGDATDPELRHTVAASLTEDLAEDLDVSRGSRTAFTTGCVAATQAIIQGVMLVTTGRTDLALTGGGYLVDEEFFAKFDSGRALTTDTAVRAFSAGRGGLLLGDGVAVLALEPLATARRPLTEIVGWGLSSDGYHVCQPHPDGLGMATAMTAALRRAGLRPADIGYVNAHGTGTKLNDAAETAALHRVFGAHAPGVPVSSTKTMTGHTLEGSGALEAVIGLLALVEGTLPPTAGYTGRDPACDLDYVPVRPRPAGHLRHVLSVNAAFGGVNAALLLAKPS